MLHEILDVIANVVQGLPRSGRPLTKQESKGDLLGLWILGAIIIIAGLGVAGWRHWR